MIVALYPPPPPHPAAPLPAHFDAPGARIRAWSAPASSPTNSREQANRQRARRRALWLAVHGVDIGPGRQALLPRQ